MAEAKWMPGERESWVQKGEENGYQVIRDMVDDLEKELDYLRWFKRTANFGPADSDVHAGMDENYTYETGKPVPKDWAQEEE